MFVDQAATFAPGDAQGVTGGNSSVQNVPRYQLPQVGQHTKVIIGALVLLVVLYLVHRSRRGRRG